MPSTKKPYTKTEMLGAYQILGGIIGLIVICILIFKIDSFNLTTLLFIGIALSFYCYSIFCGALIFRNEDRGLKHSMFNQFIQLICFSVWGVSFQYVSGIALGIDLVFTNGFDYHISFVLSNIRVFIDPDIGTRIVGINFIALFIILFINRQRRILRQQFQEKQLSEFGHQ
ncbi:MAG: hypothetical protein ABI402_11385 [Ferruginibacter sp.]